MSSSGSESPLATDASESFGVLQVGPARVALALSGLREVLPAPQAYQALPALGPDVLGALDVRGLVIPVLELRGLLGIAGEAHPDAVVVVVADSGRILGLRVDRLDRLIAVPSSARMAVQVNGGSAIVSDVFRHPDNGDVVSVIDIALLLSSVDVPSVSVLAQPQTGWAQGAATPKALGSSVPGSSVPGSSVPGSSVAVVAAAAKQPLEHYTVLRCGAYLLALGVAYVHTTLPAVTADPSILSSSLCRGSREYLGKSVAVVDPMRLLRLGQLDGATPNPGMVVQLDRGYLTIEVEGLHDIVTIAPEAIRRLPEFAVAEPGLVRGMAITNSGAEVLVIDGEALLAHTELRSLAAMNTSVDDVPLDGAAGSAVTRADDGLNDESTTASAGAGRFVRELAQLCFNVGINVVTPLSTVSEILPVPDGLTCTTTSRDIAGVLMHRDRAIPVVVLAQVLGLSVAPRTETSCLLIVDLPDTCVAFLVDGLRDIVTISWRDPAADARAGHTVNADRLRKSPLVRLGEDPKLVPQLDLLAVAREIAGSTDSAANADEWHGALGGPETPADVLAAA